MFRSMSWHIYFSGYTDSRTTVTVTYQLARLHCPCQAALFKNVEKQADFLLILSNFNRGKTLQKCRYVKPWTAPSPTFWWIHLIHFSCSKSTAVWLLNSPVTFSSWLQISWSWSTIQQGKKTFFIRNSFTMLRKRRKKNSNGFKY